MCSPASRETTVVDHRGRGVVAIALLAWTAGALAQQPTDIAASVGFQGHVKVGAWAPVRVVVNNARGAAASGELLLPPQPANEDQAFRLALDLPPSSRRAFTLYLRYDAPSSPVRVELRLKDRRRLSADAPCAPHVAESRLVLAISRTAGGLSFIGAVPLPPRTSRDSSGASPDSVVAYASPDATTGALGLPDQPAGYGGLAAVVVRDVSPASFQPEERDALIQWVRLGGLLVIVAGPNAAELRDSFLEELSPLCLRGERVLPSLKALAEHFGAPVPAGQALVADGEPTPDAQVIARQDGVPILARRQVDNGTVYFCAADMVAPPLRDADRLLLAIWGRLLEDAPQAPQWAVTEGHVRATPLGVASGTVRLPVARWDAFAIFGGFLLGYIVFLVPLNRLLLRRADRREWTGWLVLGFIALFSAGAFALGRSARLGTAQAYEGAVVRARSGSAVGSLHGIVGLRSPSRTEFSVSGSAGGRTVECLVASRHMPPPPVDEQRGFGARNVPIDLWGFGAFRVEGPLDLGGRVSARLAVVGGQNLTVVVENGTPYTMRLPFVLTSTNLHPLQDLAPGSSRQCDPFPQTEVLLGNPAPMGNIAPRLLQHCHAADERAMPAYTRIRARLLAHLGASTGGRRAPWYPWRGASFGMPRDGEALLPARPLFGAWVELPEPLVEISPAPGARTSQVLLLVEVPCDLAVPLQGSVTFGPIQPQFQAGTAGLQRDWQGKLTLRSGRHDLWFQVPQGLGRRRVTRLAVTVGCNQPGLSAEAYNLRTGRYVPLRVMPGRSPTTELRPPEDYGPTVRVSLSRTQARDTQVTCTVSGTLGPGR